MDENAIKVQRTRTEPIDFEIKQNDAFFRISDNEYLIFVVRRNEESPAAVYKLMTTDNINESEMAYSLKLTPEELNLQSGNYFYDLAYQTSNGDVIPLIKYAPFVITKASMDGLNDIVQDGE